jgi:ATP-dependent Clp protease adaptor protein ClpS
VELLRDEPKRRTRVRPRVRPKPDADPERERPWRVLLHNDDFTPAEFVTQALHDVFGLGWARATLVMVKAHVSGTAQVTVLPRDEAQARVAQVHSRARAAGWPLRLSAQPAE